MSIEDSATISNIINSLTSELSCGECKKEYKTKNKLMLHIRKVHCTTSTTISDTQTTKKLNAKDGKKKTQTQNECPVCAETFVNKSKLIRHLLCHIVIKTNGSEIITDFKKEPAPSPPEEILNDIGRDICGAPTKLVCNACNAEYEKKTELIKHLKCEHPELFPCKNRKSSTKRKRRKNAPEDYERILVDDGRKESVENFRKLKEISECTLCKAPFSMKKNLLKHMKVIHRIENFEISLEDRKPKIGHQCSECEKVFSLRKNLFQHLRKIHGKTDVGRKTSCSSETVRLICDACGVGFGEKKSLMRHLRFKHAVKFSKEKKTVAICVHCNSTFAHRKSLYKHERKFHGAQYKKISKELSKNDSKRVKERLQKWASVNDYECLKEILPPRSDYKLLQFAWLRHENYPDTTSNWFKAKFHFFCENKEDVKRWKESYEMMNKLCLRVLSFPRPRTPGVLYKGRFRCHHNTMPKKGAKPNAKHTACTAVLSITLLEQETPPQTMDDDLDDEGCRSANEMKVLVFLKNTHNHALGDPASLKYRKPIHEVKEKFLKLFEAKKTVPQALAIHKADLEKEYDADRIQSVINDRAYMPDARWAYGLYYSCYKRKKCDDTIAGSSVHQEEAPPLSPENTTFTLEYAPLVVQSADPSPSAAGLPPQQQQQQLSSPPVPPPPQPPPPPLQQQQQQDPYKLMADMFRSVCKEIVDRYEKSPLYLYPALQNFVSAYETGCQTDGHLLAALQMFGKFYANTAAATATATATTTATVANCRTRASFPVAVASAQKSVVGGLQSVDFGGRESNASTVTVATTFHPFAKYSGVSTVAAAVGSKNRLVQSRTPVVQPAPAVANEREMLTAITAAAPAITINEMHNGIEARTFFAVETAKYDDCILYPIENRQNVTANCWLPANYEMF